MMTVERLDYDKATINLHVTSQVERDLRIRSAKKEPETIRFLHSLDSGTAFFDVGANIGAYSFVAASLGLRVYAFEPPGPTFERLEQNIDLNEELKVFAYPILLGDENTTVPFAYSSMEPGSALHSLGASGENVVNLQMKTLDSVVEEYSLPWPEALKVDTDGSELRVLVGAEESLKHVCSLQVEIDDDLPASTHIPSFLQKKGLTVYEWNRHHQGPISNVWFRK